MKQVTQPEYHAFIRQYTNRQSYRTGIVEPPQEICKLPDGVIIGRIIFSQSYADVGTLRYELA